MDGKRIWQQGRHWLAGLMVLALTACGGSGGGGGATPYVPESYTANGVVSTFAGPVPGADGIGAAAHFRFPNGAVVLNGNLYVADTDNHTVRKIVIASRQVTTLAGLVGQSGGADGTGAAARFNRPNQIATDGTNLYVTEAYGHTVRKIETATGVVTTLAGSAGISGSADGIGTAARFNWPSGIVCDGLNLYVGDNNHTIRKIVIASGLVSTLAGSAGVPDHVDGTGNAARFVGVSGVALDGGNLYVTSNHTIRKIVLTTGQVTTLAGAAGVDAELDGTGAAARFETPQGIVSDGTHLYVADYWGHTIRKVVIATGVVTTLAGSASETGVAGAIGTAARFYAPSGLATDGTNLYVTDSYNHNVRKIVLATAAVSTLAGANPSADGTGTSARFVGLSGSLVGDAGNLYVADYGGSTIRKINIATREVSTFSGVAYDWRSVDGSSSQARFSTPAGIVSDGTHLYVTDAQGYSIRKIVIATGAVTTLAGSAAASGSTDGTGAAARFLDPYAIASDGNNLYVTDKHSIRKIVIATGVVTTLAGSAGNSGSADGTGSAARFYYPSGLAVVGTDLYVADGSNHTIRKIVIATGQVTTIAGKAGTSGNTDGTGVAALFDSPQGIFPYSGYLYVANNLTVRRLNIATGQVITVAGNASAAGGVDGTGIAASFSGVYGVTVAGGNLYIADCGNGSIRKITGF